MKISIFIQIAAVFFFTVFVNNVYGDSNKVNTLVGKNLKIRLYLEGALINSPDVYSFDGRRLMRDDLRRNPLNGKNYIPLSDPYQTVINGVNLSAANAHVGIGSLPEYCTITDSVTVLGLAGANAIVDWVFVEIRSSADVKNVIATRSGLLQRDGDIVDVDGVSDLNFPDLTVDEFYVAVRHRNHLGVMSQLVTGASLIDFTNKGTLVYDFGNTNPMFDYSGKALCGKHFGVNALWAGDFNADCVVKCDRPANDLNILMSENLALSVEGGTQAIGYLQGDFDMNGYISFEHKYSDIEYLMGQIKSFDLNTATLANFKYMAEQIPTRE
ncbi:MAG TPA: hypothetical protein PKD51_11660 [Saprospiraceae bacterium]|nr:hypothetical protein [Saprospiraceae bacterium]HMU02094.1 hypothetical protein [Saprospiraceae bacterium]